jgi:hypothetical protein
MTRPFGHFCAVLEDSAIGRVHVPEVSAAISPGDGVVGLPEEDMEVPVHDMNAWRDVAAVLYMAMEWRQRDGKQ